MLSLWKRDVPESYLAPDKIEQKYRELHAAPLTGGEVYRQYCAACHGTGTYGRWDKKFRRFVPAIRGASLISNASVEYLRTNIEQGRPGTQMPAWGPHAGGLLPEEIAAVIDYLREGVPAVPAAAAIPGPGDSTRGLSLFLRNCAGCHGVDGRGGLAPEIGNPVFQQSASDEFIVRTIRDGRVETAMPSFQRKEAPTFTDRDIADVLAYLRTLSERGGQKTAAGTPSSASPSGGPS
jgi:cbb3-type cytochrome c oxidase subunit III